MTKSRKHCGKRRNCLFWAISSFVTMFPKSRGVRKRLYEKGLRIRKYYDMSSSLNMLKMYEFILSSDPSIPCMLEDSFIRCYSLHNAHVDMDSKFIGNIMLMIFLNLSLYNKSAVDDIENISLKISKLLSETRVPQTVHNTPVRDFFVSL